jgi:hypothetical protein
VVLLLVDCARISWCESGGGDVCHLQYLIPTFPK